MSLLKDARGEAVSTTSQRALEHYEEALWRFHSYFGDPVAVIDAALAEDPDFVLGHAFRATMLLMMTEQRYLPEVRASLAAAEALFGRANDRERGLVLAVRRWLAGDWRGAALAWDAVLAEHPRDPFALQAAHLSDFYLGDAVSLRDRIARVLPEWSEALPSYSYVLGMYAFGLEECNQYALAEETGRRALALEPRDPWAIHAVAHVMEMQARFDEGIHWYREREADWAPDNGFAFHNWWHNALYHLERGESAQALALYDARIYPEPSEMSLQLLDASALLWRLQLLGTDVGGRWAALADAWEAKAADENGYYAFNDVHALMAFLGAGRDAAVECLLAELERTVEAPGINATMTREVGLPLARALIAFARGRYGEAVDALLPIRTLAHRFGGSHAQRDLLSQTLLTAAIRAGRHGLARNLANERVMHKPHSPLARRYREQAQRAVETEPSALA